MIPPSDLVRQVDFDKSGVYGGLIPAMLQVVGALDAATPGDNFFKRAPASARICAMMSGQSGTRRAGPAHNKHPLISRSGTIRFGCSAV